MRTSTYNTVHSTIDKISRWRHVSPSRRPLKNHNLQKNCRVQTHSELFDVNIDLEITSRFGTTVAKQPMVAFKRIIDVKRKKTSGRRCSSLTSTSTWDTTSVQFYTQQRTSRRSTSVEGTVGFVKADEFRKWYQMTKQFSIDGIMYESGISFILRDRLCIVEVTSLICRRNRYLANVYIMVNFKSNELSSPCRWLLALLF